MRVNEIRAQMSQVQGIIDMIAPKPPDKLEVDSKDEGKQEEKKKIEEQLEQTIEDTSRFPVNVIRLDMRFRKYL